MANFQRLRWRLLISTIVFSSFVQAKPALPVGVREVTVKKDLAAYVLPSVKERSQVIVYLAGRCGDALAGLRSFPEAAREVGTMISVQGDIACPKQPGRRRWSSDPRQIQRRIDAAIQATATALDRDLSRQDLILIGYSEGALRAESLTGAFPERYSRIVLGGGPRVPNPVHFRKAKAVATLAGENDLQKSMRDGAEILQKSGILSQFFVLPKASHGQYGPDGGRILKEVFSWILGG